MDKIILINKKKLFKIYFSNINGQNLIQINIKTTQNSKNKNKMLIMIKIIIIKQSNIKLLIYKIKKKLENRIKMMTKIKKIIKINNWILNKIKLIKNKMII